MDTKNKPLLSAETCERLGLLKVTINETSKVNTMVTKQDKLRVPLARKTFWRNIKMCLKVSDTLGFPVVLLLTLTTPLCSMHPDVSL